MRRHLRVRIYIPTFESIDSQTKHKKQNYVPEPKKQKLKSTHVRPKKTHFHSAPAHTHAHAHTHTAHPHTLHTHTHCTPTFRKTPASQEPGQNTLPCQTTKITNPTRRRKNENNYKRMKSPKFVNKTGDKLALEPCILYSVISTSGASGSFTRSRSLGSTSMADDGVTVT
jgi:hypothetical protein